MARSECEAAIEAGREVVSSLGALDVLAVGEMGIGNTTSASALAAALLGLSPERVTGRGTGIDAARLAHKQEVIAQALALHATRDANEALVRLGGFELAALVGAIEMACKRGACATMHEVRTYREANLEHPDDR
jgi:nicotinate-nucleotide--dimethylbenzimidazole phosphoribosyltransferase